MILKCRGVFQRKVILMPSPLCLNWRPDGLTPVRSQSSVGCMLLSCPTPPSKAVLTSKGELVRCPREGLVEMTRPVHPEACLMSLTKLLASGLPPHADVRSVGGHAPHSQLMCQGLPCTAAWQSKGRWARNCMAQQKQP